MALFSLKRDELMLNLRPAEEIVPIPPASDRRAWDGVNPEARRELSTRADHSMRNIPEPLGATLFLSGAPYAQMHTEHIQWLESLIAGACVTDADRYMPILADAIWAELERTSWADPDASGPMLPDVDKPAIDLCCARTACALALAARLLKPQLRNISPMIIRRLARELDIRVFDPLASGRGGVVDVGRRDMLPALDMLMTAVLLTEFDSDRRWLCVRHLCELVERELRRQLPDGGMSDGLENHVRNCCALSNILALLSSATGGAVELRDEELFTRMAALPASLHIIGGWFLNPGGESPKAQLDWDQLFLLGDSARSSELCALSAHLSRLEQSTRQVQPLMQELQRALYRNLFLREPARLVQRPAVRFPNMQLLSARMGPFYAGLTGGANQAGSGHLDAGDFTLFYRDRPIIIEPGHDPSAQMHSVPEVELLSQGYTGLEPHEGTDSRFDSHLVLLSLGIAHAYPASSGLLNWQRSVMMSAFEGTVRLMDVIDFDHAQTRQLSFYFMTPLSPHLTSDAVLLGDIALTWEGDLSPSVERVTLREEGQCRAFGSTIYRIRFATQVPVSSGKYAFIFQPTDPNK